MPFVIGIPSSFLDEARNLSGTEGQLVFVLLDEGKVQLEGVDVSPTESMPPAALRRLDRRLHSLHSALPPRLRFGIATTTSWSMKRASTPNRFWRA